VDISSLVSACGNVWFWQISFCLSLIPLSIILSSMASLSRFIAIWLLFSATLRQLILLCRSASSFWILADSAAMVRDWELCLTELAV